MSAHHKQVSDLESKQVEIDKTSLWAKLPIIGAVLAVVGFAAGFLTPAPGGAFTDDPELWEAKKWTGYLNGFMFAMALAFGGLIFTIIQHLVRANWSIVVRRIAESAMFALPFVALGGLPLLFGHGGHAVFEWMHVEAVLADPMLKAKVAYLNASSFGVRFAFYLLIWAVVSLLFWSWSRKQDHAKTDEEAAAFTYKQRFLAPIALIAFSLSMTFGAFDFMMSLDPHWFSTIFGVYYFAGIALTFRPSLVADLLRAPAQRHAPAGVVTAEHYHDLGKFMFGFTVFWTYIGFSQYFLIWYANIPEETHWFKYRWSDGWMAVSLVLLLGHFVVPFTGLLSRHVKRGITPLIFWAAWQFVMHLVDIYWVVMPNLTIPRKYWDRPAIYESWTPNLLEPLVWAGVGALFIAYLIKTASGRNLVPTRDPRLTESRGFHNI
jgi:hypothetical protein